MAFVNGCTDVSRDAVQRESGAPLSGTHGHRVWGARAWTVPVLQRTTLGSRSRGPEAAALARDTNDHATCGGNVTPRAVAERPPSSGIGAEFGEGRLHTVAVGRFGRRWPQRVWEGCERRVAFDPSDHVLPGPRHETKPPTLTTPGGGPGQPSWRDCPRWRQHSRCRNEAVHIDLEMGSAARSAPGGMAARRHWSRSATDALSARLDWQQSWPPARAPRRGHCPRQKWFRQAARPRPAAMRPVSPKTCTSVSATAPSRQVGARGSVWARARRRTPV